MARKSAGRARVGARSSFERDIRPPFKTAIHNGELAQLQQWVLRHDDIETGGDLFGLWSTDNTAVVQLVLGPGRRSHRTTTSFFQDAVYLGEVGNRLTKEYGLCHIGEWHSHHRLGLAHPSAGDQSTVWRHLPSNGFKRFIVCIANIDATQHCRRATFSPTSKQEVPVGLGCFLFEVKDTCKWQQYDMLQGSFDVIHGQSPYRELPELSQIIDLDAETVNSTSQVDFKEPWSGSRSYDTGNKGTTILLNHKSGGTSLHYSIDTSSYGLRHPPSSRTSNTPAKTPSEGRSLTSSRSRHGLLGSSATSRPDLLVNSANKAKPLDRQAKTNPVMHGRQTVTGALRLWDRLTDSQKSFLEKLTDELTGQQIKEQWAVTVNFKVRVPRKSDLACRLVYHEDELHQLRLYTTGVATDYFSIKLDSSSMHWLETTTPTVKRELGKVIEVVVAQMPITYTPGLRSGTNQNLQQYNSPIISRADARLRRSTNILSDQTSIVAERNRRGRSSPVVRTSASSSSRPKWK